MIYEHLYYPLLLINDKCMNHYINIYIYMHLKNILNGI